ncbi:hypothetical protein J010_06782 [Cryptococcus neoformans]|nr:hypothetical protein C353_06804 [Cryptococcus neoformans var. grubii AD1-83a]OXG30398.1 hypothetical protein C360_04768 [Cryptococcus neoformans var. grubii Bt15]OXG41217.1 hypothetical protein C355_06800 [Cryptococcus neoformans var. grubii Th84]OXG43731.1 hypothetical protein C354_06783 [Cryptococcus neoformans var. grubii MW-RSA1955]OXG47815.1 hypothetical protein C352_06804 [Cryptococcus neoformans var. grubii CHC193]OXG56446.1 hypothetical protein C351_06781 [Cryptococcus neoformans va
MARPIRPAPGPTTPSAGPSTSLRTSARTRRQSASTSVASTSASALTPGPPTPASDGVGARNGAARRAPAVEAKTHGLRSTGSSVERTPCPFPAQFGGRANCGIAEEDEADEVLMGVLSAIAFYDNRALSVEEIALTCFQQGWLRPPSAAIEPTTPINNAIRSYIKRCEKAKRHCLLAKYQLAGSVVESVLEVALHPDAFNGSTRPRGAVWFLLSGSGAGSGKARWKSPFEGLEVPKMPPRKPAPKKQKENKRVDEKKQPVREKSKEKALAPVKIRLVLAGGNGEEESQSETSRSRSVSVSKDSVISEVKVEPASKHEGVAPRRYDSSSDSDTSDSDIEIGSASRLRPSRLMRKGPPPPLVMNGSPRVFGPSRLPQQSPFVDLFFPSPAINTFAPPHASPFPSHSLDNTTWTARHDHNQRHLDYSSSSEEDEVVDLEWGVASDVIIRDSVEGETKPTWSLEDEAKVKEATDALRVLFPLEEPEEDIGLEKGFELIQSESRPTGTDSPSISEPGSIATSATARNSFRNKLKAIDAGGLPLNAWVVNSSPIPSPKIRPFKAFHQAPPVDFSPTQHFSKLRGSFDPDESMDVDDEPWLDETGELPVKAEDTFSDVDLNSTIDEIASPEHDRRLHTALWAQEAAATIRVKAEPEDFPTPSSIEDEPMQSSRASSTPSYGPSDGPDYDDIGMESVADEKILGPESVSVEELDGWLPTVKIERTPHRGRPRKGGKDKSDGQKLGCWGGIGVCSSGKRATRSNMTLSTATRRRKSKSCFERLTPVSDSGSGLVTAAGGEDENEVDDAIGTEDLEKARVEADACEEEHRKACKEKAERQRVMLEAYRQTVRAELSDTDITPSPWEAPSSAAPWGSSSTDSLQLPTPGALSPMVLHSVPNSSLATPGEGQHMMSVDPKALVSPPLQNVFGQGISGQRDLGMGLGVGMLDAALTQQEVDDIMGTSSAPTTAPSSTSATTPATPSMSTASVLAPTLQRPAASRPISGSAPPSSNVPAIQPTPVPVLSASAPNEKGIAIVALPTTLPDSAQASNTNTNTPAAASAASRQPVHVPKPIAKSTKPISSSATPSRSSTPSTASSGSGTSRSGGKIATITKPLCPGVDACVVDNIPVYAHLFEGRNGSGKQVLLRRLDTDFVNANALLHALGVSPSKHPEYLDHPISQARLASRHVVQPSTSGVEYSNGVSGIWVHLSEAREFARRAKLAGGSLLASVLREDLFQLFATLAQIKPDHPPSESFGLPFVPRRQTPPTSTMSTNSKSTPNLLSLSTSAPAPTANHIRPASSGVSAPINGPKGPLVRTAPATPLDGCPQSKRRRATISSPLAKRPGVAPGSVALAPAPASSEIGGGAAVGVAVGIGAEVPKPIHTTVTAAQKRATRASIGGMPVKPASG